MKTTNRNMTDVEANQVLDQEQVRQQRWADEKTDVMDNALSAWASGLTTERAHLALKINAYGGMAPFEVLYLNGERIEAITQRGQFGLSWRIGSKWYPWATRLGKKGNVAAKSKLAKDGYEVRFEWRPAIAEIKGDKTAYVGITQDMEASKGMTFKPCTLKEYADFRSIGLGE